MAGARVSLLPLAQRVSRTGSHAFAWGQPSVSDQGPRGRGILPDQTGNAGVPAMTPPPSFSLPLDDVGLIPVYSSPWKCIMSSHHICSPLKTQGRNSSNPRVLQEGSTVAVQLRALSPSSLPLTPSTLMHSVGLASAFHSCWGSVRGCYEVHTLLDLLGPQITSSLFAPQAFAVAVSSARKSP